MECDRPGWLVFRRYQQADLKRTPAGRPSGGASPGISPLHEPNRRTWPPGTGPPRGCSITHCTPQDLLANALRRHRDAISLAKPWSADPATTLALQPHRTPLCKPLSSTVRFKERARSSALVLRECRATGSSGHLEVASDEIPTSSPGAPHPLRRAIPGSIERKSSSTPGMGLSTSSCF